MKLLVSAIGLLYLITGCHKDTPVQKRPINLLILTLDTLRADHLSFYGAKNVDTPALDGLARNGCAFLNATAPAPLTLPSHASLFTGLYPVSHGVRDNVGFALPQEALTLAEVLKENSFTTAGFVSAFVLHKRFGMDQGFDHYSDYFDLDKRDGVLSPDSIQKCGEDTVAEALKWLDTSFEPPFFMWVHLFDPHAPYDPPELYASRYANDPYGGDVAFTDSIVAGLLDGLKVRGLMDNTLIVALGDHGEGLGDHKESFHGLFVYDTTIQVPLIFHGPGVSPNSIPSQVRLIDVFPTVLDLLELKVPEGITGKSLMPLIDGAVRDMGLAALSESWYPNLHYGWSELKSLRAGKYKYILAPKPELYDLSLDPGETANLADKEPAIASRMKKNLLELEKRSASLMHGQAAEKTVDSQASKALRLLGYTGTSGKPTQGDLQDPKDFVDLVLQSAKAERLISNGDAFGAIAILESVVMQAPTMIDARLNLGTAHFLNKDYEMAAHVFKGIVTDAPDCFNAWANLGLAHKGLGRFKKAIAAYTKALKIDPKSTEMMKQIIDVCYTTQRFSKCIQYCRAYLELDPNAPQVRVILGLVLINNSKGEKALEQANLALASDPRITNGMYVKGKALILMKDFKGAQTVFEDGLKQDDKDLNLIHGLAEALSKSRRVDEALSQVDRALALDPNNFTSNLLYAQICYKDNRINERAKRAARKACEISPSSIVARTLLKDMLEK